MNSIDRTFYRFTGVGMLVRRGNKECWENTRIGCYTHTPPDRDAQTYLSFSQIPPEL